MRLTKLTGGGLESKETLNQSIDTSVEESAGPIAAKNDVYLSKR